MWARRSVSAPRVRRCSERAGRQDRTVKPAVRGRRDTGLPDRGLADAGLAFEDEGRERAVRPAPEGARPPPVRSLARRLRPPRTSPPSPASAVRPISSGATHRRRARAAETTVHPDAIERVSIGADAWSAPRRVSVERRRDIGSTARGPGAAQCGGTRRRRPRIRGRGWGTHVRGVRLTIRLVSATRS